MKEKIIFILFMLSFRFCFGQNLVPNPSFEDSISCPNSTGQIYLSVGWSSFGQTPDYLSSCATSCSFPATCFGIPDNAFGHQAPYDGNSYAGLCTFHEGLLFHEYIGIQLAQPLIIGKRYYVSAYISRANGIGDHGASNNFGFRFFLTNPYSQNAPCPTDNYSQVHDTSIVTDSINWTRMSGSFIADTAFQYLALGNFYDDQHTDTLDIVDSIHSILNSAYYYVDYVCVTGDSLNCSVINSINSISDRNNFNLFPNPFTDRLTINTNDNNPSETIIFNIFSEKILEQKFTNSITLNTEHFDKGIYFYEVTDKNGFIRNGKIIKN